MMKIFSISETKAFKRLLELHTCQNRICARRQNFDYKLPAYEEEKAQWGKYPFMSGIDFELTPCERDGLWGSEEKFALSLNGKPASGLLLAYAFLLFRFFGGKLHQAKILEKT